jgi:hypothetical protein
LEADWFAEPSFNSLGHGAAEARSVQQRTVIVASRA